MENHGIWKRLPPEMIGYIITFLDYNTIKDLPFNNQEIYKNAILIKYPEYIKYINTIVSGSNIGYRTGLCILNQHLYSDFYSPKNMFMGSVKVHMSFLTNHFNISAIRSSFSYHVMTKNQGGWLHLPRTNPKNKDDLFNRKLFELLFLITFPNIYNKINKLKINWFTLYPNVICLLECFEISKVNEESLEHVYNTVIMNNISFSNYPELNRAFN